MNKYYRTHILMFMLTLIWAADAITVSAAVESINQIALLCFKYIFALPVIALYVHITQGLRLPDKGDVPALFVSMLFGDIIYFASEYTALKYLSPGMATLFLCFIPAASYLVNCAVGKKMPDGKILFYIAATIAGLVPVTLGAETDRTANFIGIASCVVCTASFIIYCHVTRRLSAKYTSAALTIYQQALAIAVMLPVALTHIPTGLPVRDTIISIVIMGIMANGIGFIIELKGVVELGSTVTGIYINLLPVFSSAGAVIFLGDRLTPWQIAGGAVVLVFSCLVIQKTEELN